MNDLEHEIDAHQHTEALYVAEVEKCKRLSCESNLLKTAVKDLHAREVEQSCEDSRKNEALTTLAALYGAHAKHLRKAGSCFRDNLEMSLDEVLSAEHIEELLQTAWKASEDGVSAAVSEGQNHD